jgi:hypothetical protein
MFQDWGKSDFYSKQCIRAAHGLGFGGGVQHEQQKPTME